MIVTFRMEYHNHVCAYHSPKNAQAIEDYLSYGQIGQVVKATISKDRSFEAQKRMCKLSQSEEPEAS